MALNLTPADRRALRDVDDGHINLYAQVARFDAHTGEPLPRPELLYVGWDRCPGGSGGGWWKPFYEAGLIAPTRETKHATMFELTDAGRAALAQHDKEASR